MLIILVSFLLSGDVDDIVNNRTNYLFNSLIVIHLMNGAEVCWIMR